MAGIKVALELDDRKYQQSLKNATTAADDFAKKVTSSATNAGNALSGMVSKIDAVHTALGKIAAGADIAATKAGNLVTTLGGLAAGAFIHSLLEGASASKDMSEAFGLSIASVLELQSAFSAAGRGPEKMNQALATLSDTSVGALQGNYALRESFSKLGLSMQDLQKMSAKEVLAQIADTMTSGNVTAAQLSATYDILGRSAKGLPWGDFKDKLDAVNGTMGPAADATKTFDDILKKLESSAGAVKREFIVLVAPVAEFLNTFIGKGENARVVAIGIASAMTVMAGAAVISGIQSIAAAIKGLVGWLGSLAGVTATATAATGTYVATAGASAAQSIIQAAGLSRVATATMALNVAEVELNALMAQGAFSAAAHAAAIDRVAAAELRLATMTEAAAATQAQLAAGMGATAAAGATTAGFFARMGAAIAAVASFFALPVWATIGVVLAGIAAAVAALTVVWKAFGPEVKELANTIGEYLISSFKTFVGWLDTAAAKLRSFFGMKPNPELTSAIDKVNEKAKKTPEQEAEQKRLAAAYLNAQATGNASSSPSSSEAERAVGAGTAQLNPMAAQEESLRRQLGLLQLQNDQQQEKLNLQLQLVGLGEAEKSQRMASLDFQQKQASELFRINTEISKMQQQAANEPGGAAKYAAQIGLLKQQRDLIQGQVDDTSQLQAAIVLAGQAEKDRLYFLDQESKVRKQLKDMNQQIADFNLSEDNRRIAAIQNQIQLEQIAAVKRRQDELGKTPISDEESLSIMERIAAAYDPLIAKQKEYNSELAKNDATKFALDLQNKAIENQINLTSELAKLTQTSDQQRITDLNTQLELQARQEIVRRQSKLAPGEKLSTEEQAAIRKQVFDSNQDLITSTQAVIDKSREFQTGWNTAFNQYKSDAFNAANEAKTYFDTFSKGFEDAFVKMVQTGKLSFKDLANNMIAEFTRIQARKLFAGLFGDATGTSGGDLLGNMWGGVKKIFGFANGGVPPVGVPSLVGENGPELFVPRTAGSIVPNGQLGGTTNVNYNIQAVDAASFRQMIARDPEFLYAVTEKGRSAIPSGRR